MRLTENGARIRCVGSARRNPKRLLSLGYVPRYKLELFGVTYYMCDVRQNEDVRFFPAYIVHEGEVHARLLYKDGSLLWRCASHFAKSATENWIGKGDLKLEVENGCDVLLHRRAHHRPAARDADGGRVAHAAREPGRHRPRGARARSCGARPTTGSARTATSPSRAGARRRTRATSSTAGRSIARFLRPNVPESLRFAAGFEPDFRSGLIDVDPLAQPPLRGRGRALPDPLAQPPHAVPVLRGAAAGLDRLSAAAHDRAVELRRAHDRRHRPRRPRGARRWSTTTWSSTSRRCG